MEERKRAEVLQGIMTVLHHNPSFENRKAGQRRERVNRSPQKTQKKNPDRLKSTQETVRRRQVGWDKDKDYVCEGSKRTNAGEQSTVRNAIWPNMRVITQRQRQHKGRDARTRKCRRDKNEEVAPKRWSLRWRLRWAGVGAVGPERLRGLTDGKLIIGARKASRKFFLRSKRN